MSEQQLILISRNDLQAVGEGKGRDKLLRQLARLTRQGFSLLITAPQPDNWSSKHGGPDNVLIGENNLRTMLSDAGGILDGIYYVPRSLMTQRRNRQEAFLDIMNRYAVGPENISLYSSSKRWAEMAEHLGISTTYLGSGKNLLQELKDLEEPVSDQQ